MIKAQTSARNAMTRTGHFTAGGRSNIMMKKLTAWILALILWCGSGLAFLLLFLYAGKDDANDFGASPYSAAK